MSRDTGGSQLARSQHPPPRAERPAAPGRRHRRRGGARHPGPLRRRPGPGHPGPRVPVVHLGGQRGRIAAARAHRHPGGRTVVPHPFRPAVRRHRVLWRLHHLLDPDGRSCPSGASTGGSPGRGLPGGRRWWPGCSPPLAGMALARGRLLPAPGRTTRSPIPTTSAALAGGRDSGRDADRDHPRAGRGRRRRGRPPLRGRPPGATPVRLELPARASWWSTCPARSSSACWRARPPTTGSPATWLTVAGTGLIGAYTTFSTFTFDTVSLLERRRWGPAVTNRDRQPGGRPGRGSPAAWPSGR